MYLIAFLSFVALSLSASMCFVGLFFNFFRRLAQVFQLFFTFFYTEKKTHYSAYFIIINT